MTSRPARIIATVLLLGVAAVLVSMWLVRAELQRVAVTERDLTFTVPTGSSLRSVLRELSTQQVVHHPRLLEWWERWQFGAHAGLRSGNYVLASGSTTRQLLDQLREGRVVLEQLTLIEGWTFEQFRTAVAAQTGLVHAWSSLTPADIMRQLGAAGVHPEGRFFPDTYRFSAGTSDAAIYRMAYERMNRELAAAWAARRPDSVLASPEQLLIFASLIEKETGREDERARIAGVFTNRLRRHMRLQSDPTVIYGLGSRYDGDIRSRDLLTDTPYNTYTRDGLPPTPIAMPGAASLRAAAQPEDTPALFFVATGNGDGSHHFSSTLEEHNLAVARLVKRTRRHP